MQRIKLLAAVLLVCSNLLGQESGYFGKRTVIEIEGNGSIPLFTNIFTEKGYLNRGGKLQESFNLLDYGFRVSLGRMTSLNDIAAFEYSYRRYQVNPLNDGELNRQYTDADGNVKTDYIYPKVAFLEMQEHVFMPKIVFTNDLSGTPAGFSNEIGIAYTVTKFSSRTPLAVYPQGNGAYSADSIGANMIDPKFKSMAGMTVMYGFRMKFPVSKSLLFHIGFRYSYNLLFDRNEYRQRELSESWLSESEIWSLVNRRRQLGIASFSAGFTICL